MGGGRVGDGAGRKLAGEMKIYLPNTLYQW